MSEWPARIFDVSIDGTKALLTDRAPSSEGHGVAVAVSFRQASILAEGPTLINARLARACAEWRVPSPSTAHTTLDTFTDEFVEAADVHIQLRRGGTGPPLLMRE